MAFYQGMNFYYHACNIGHLPSMALSCKLQFLVLRMRTPHAPSPPLDLEEHLTYTVLAQDTQNLCPDQRVSYPSSRISSTSSQGQILEIIIISSKSEHFFGYCHIYQYICTFFVDIKYYSSHDSQPGSDLQISSQDQSQDSQTASCHSQYLYS